MLTLKHLAVIGFALVAAASPAIAGGTKYSANLVTSDAGDPPTPPDLSPKSSIKLDSKGAIAVSLSGVTDGAGLLVTTSGNYKDTFLVDDSTYVVIIKLYIPGIAGFIPAVELPVPVDLKAGKGKTKLSAAPLFASIPGGLGRSIEITGAEVWGPMGMAKVASCNAVLLQPVPASLMGADPACRGGTQIGISGLYIPVPTP